MPCDRYGHVHWSQLMPLLLVTVDGLATVAAPSVLNALNREEILDVIDAHDNVTAFINGHDHGGAFGVRKGVPYVTMPGMLSGATNAYGIAHLYKDRLEIDGYGRVPSRVLIQSQDNAA